MLDLSKHTYELLNNQLVDELPLLYQHSYQIVSMCLHAFIIGHVHLMRQMQTNIRLVFAQVGCELGMNFLLTLIISVC